MQQIYWEYKLHLAIKSSFLAAKLLIKHQPAALKLAAAEPYVLYLPSMNEN